MIAIIPIRKGSLRIKNKNLRKIKTKTLTEITLEQALKSKSFKKIVVYHDYKNLNFKLKFKTIDFIKRPKSISNCTSTTEETLIYFFKKNTNFIKYVDFCILQVTSPLRKISTILSGIKTFKGLKNKSLISVKKANPKSKKSKLPHYIKDKVKYIPNGVLYVSNIKKFLKTKKIYNRNSKILILGEKESIDVDTYSDLQQVRELF